MSPKTINISLSILIYRYLRVELFKNWKWKWMKYGLLFIKGVLLTWNKFIVSVNYHWNVEWLSINFCTVMRINYFSNHNEWFLEFMSSNEKFRNKIRWLRITFGYLTLYAPSLELLISEVFKYLLSFGLLWAVPSSKYSEISNFTQKILVYEKWDTCFKTKSHNWNFARLSGILRSWNAYPPPLSDVWSTPWRKNYWKPASRCEYESFVSSLILIIAHNTLGKNKRTYNFPQVIFSLFLVQR